LQKIDLTTTTTTTVITQTADFSSVQLNLIHGLRQT
jgi:hypothetical protein